VKSDDGAKTTGQATNEAEAELYKGAMLETASVNVKVTGELGDKKDS